MKLLRSGQKPIPVDDSAVAASQAADRAETAFRTAYGIPPTGVWWAPATLPLLGDYAGGSDARVLSVALPWGVAAALAPVNAQTVEVRTTRPPTRAIRFTASRPPRRLPDWATALPAVLASPERHGTGLQIMLDFGPLDAAPALTAAYAVLLATTELHQGTDAAADRAALARTAREILAAHLIPDAADAVPETALRVTADHAFLLDSWTGRGRLVPLALAQAGLRLLVVDARTGPLPNRTAAQRRAECARAARILGVSSLREVSDLAAALARLDDAVLRHRIRHAVAETHRVNAVIGLLRAGSVAEIGPALNAGHLSLRDAFATVCPRLDAAADTAVRKGARGARMAGSGHRVAALVPAERLDSVCAGIRAAFAARRWSPPVLGVANPASGAHRLR